MHGDPSAGNSDGTGLWCGNNTALSVVTYSKIPPKIIHTYETWPTVFMTGSKIAVGQSVCDSFNLLAIQWARSKSSLSALQQQFSASRVA